MDDTTLRTHVPRTVTTARALNAAVAAARAEAPFPSHLLSETQRATAFDLDATRRLAVHLARIDGGPISIIRNRSMFWLAGADDMRNTWDESIAAGRAVLVEVVNA